MLVSSPMCLVPGTLAGSLEVPMYYVRTIHRKVRAGDRCELREGAGGVEGELHVPCGAKEGLRTYLPNRRFLLSYFLQ